MSDYMVVFLLVVAVGAAGAVCIFSAYDLGFRRGRFEGVEEERLRKRRGLR